MAKIIYEVYQNQNEHNAAYGVRHSDYDHELYGLRALLKVKSEESAERFGTFG